jgi:hypothetical protein
MGNRSFQLLLLGLASTVCMWASGISYTCDASLSSSVCDYLNTNISQDYSKIFTNANAQIYIEASSSGLGESDQFINATSYNNYVSALTSHEGFHDGTDVTAVASLPSTEPAIFGTGSVYLTSALSAALGIAGGVGTTSSGTSCTTLNPSSKTPGCFNGIIKINTTQPLFFRDGGTIGSGQFDFYNVVQHETDELLGTPSCIVGSGGVGADGCNTGMSPADLFRYSAPGTRSFFSQGNGTTAYFSYDGGNTVVAPYNNSANGADYGDWSTSCTYIQDAFGCQGLTLDIAQDTNGNGVRVEVAALDTVGYNLTPEPGTVALFGLGLAGLFLARRFASPPDSPM